MSLYSSFGVGANFCTKIENEIKLIEKEVFRYSIESYVIFSKMICDGLPVGNDGLVVDADEWNRA